MPPCSAEHRQRGGACDRVRHAANDLCLEVRGQRSRTSVVRYLNIRRHARSPRKEAIGEAMVVTGLQGCYSAWADTPEYVAGAPSRDRLRPIINNQVALGASPPKLPTAAGVVAIGGCRSPQRRRRYFLL